MIKRILTVFAAFVGIMLIMAAFMRYQGISSSVTASEPPESAARRDLPNLIQRIQFDAQNFGFTNEKEVELIALGQPYEVYSFNYKNVKQYRADMPLDQLVTFTNSWEFPVLLGEQAKGLATLADENGGLQFVGFSSNWRLAQSLVDFQSQRDNTGEMTRVKLLRADSLYTTFALIEQNGQGSVKLLSDVEPGRQRFYLPNLDQARTHDLKSLMPQIVQELVKAQQTLPRQ